MDKTTKKVIRLMKERFNINIVDYNVLDNGQVQLLDKNDNTISIITDDELDRLYRIAEGFTTIYLSDK